MRWWVAIVSACVAGTGCGRIAFDARSDGSGGGGSGDDILPGDCPNVGDVCADGSIYVGISPDGNVRMYTEAATALDGPWSTNPSTTGIQTGLTSKITGAANTVALALGGVFEDSDAGVAGIQPHESAEHCASLTAHGHTDWYLPAHDELRVLSNNQVAIGGFLADEYWSSTEDVDCPQDCAEAIEFPSGNDSSFRNKFDYRRTRCVRK